MTESNTGFSSNQRDVTLRHNLIRTGFKLIRDVIHTHLICKFQEDLIKNEILMLMTKSNGDFLSNQGDVILRF